MVEGRDEDDQLSLIQTIKHLRGEELLHVYHTEWDNFQFSSQTMSGMLDYINRFWIPRETKKDKPGIHDTNTVRPTFSLSLSVPLHLWFYNSAGIVKMARSSIHEIARIPDACTTRVDSAWQRWDQNQHSHHQRNHPILWFKSNICIVVDKPWHYFSHVGC